MQFMPKKPMTIEQAYKAFCEGRNCLNCPFDASDCKQYCIEYPIIASKQMGFFPINENANVGNEKGKCELNDLPKDVGEERPLSKWTLQEVKNLCQQHTDCKHCRFYDIEDAECYMFCTPDNWRLKRKFSKEEKEHAQIIKTFFPQVTHIEKRKEETFSKILDNTLIFNQVNVFPNINFGEIIAIDEILADGSKLS